ALDRRIKGLAVQLTQAVGVDGLQESSAAFVKRLRMHRDAILQALEHFDPTQVSSQRKARVLKLDEVDLGARRVRSRSTRPLHDLDRRIKGLAVQLTQAVGVDGLQESSAAFVKRLRMHRDAILQALEHFDPTQVSSQRKARVLKLDEVDLGARRVRSRSTRPLHD